MYCAANYVLPCRGWPRRQGFWRRIEGKVTAGRGLGSYPAPSPLIPHPGAAHWAASKTKSGLRAKRSVVSTSGNRYSYKRAHLRAPSTPVLRGPLKTCFKRKTKRPVFEATLKERLHKESFLKGVLLRAINPLLTNHFFSTCVIQEGGLCNTPLYNYLSVEQSK